MNTQEVYKPILEAPLVFTAKEDGNYVLEVNDKYFSVDCEVKEVLQILSKSTNYKNATASYVNATAELFTEEEFTFYSSEILKKFSLDKERKSFLLVEKVLLSPQMAGKIASPITFLFQPLLFWSLLGILLLFAIYATLLFTGKADSKALEIKIIPFFLWYFITIIFHELGHIAACRRFTGKNGSMGVGIYIIYPIFFSDISSIWHASKQERVIASLAGIYMQLCFVPLFFFYSIWSGTPFFLDLSRLLVYVCLIQILPFVRSDGYWLLSDILNVTNLLLKSQEYALEFFKSPVAFVQLHSPKEIAVLSYGLLNAIIVLLFTFYQLSFNYEALLNFPQYFWNLILEVFYGNINNLQFDTQYLMVFVFYYIVFSYAKLLIKYLAKLISKK